MGTATKQLKKAPKLRFRGFDDEWDQEKLGNIISIHNGFAFKSTDARQSGCRWVKIADVGVDSMKSNSPSFLPLEFTDKHSEFLLEEGDYVVALTRPILNGRLKIARISNEFAGSLLNQRVGKLVTKHHNDFVYYLIKRPDTVYSIGSRIDGNDPPNLAPSAIRTIGVSLPALSEQQKIADFLGSVDAWLDNLRQQKTALEAYKRGMMQKLFSQQVRFKDDDGNDFPEWRKKSLGEVFSAAKGSGISKDELDADGANECILYGELYTTYNEVACEVKSRTNVVSGTRSKIGDILMPCSTTTTAIDLANVTALNKEGVLLGGDITVLRGKTEVSNVFYAYYLSHHKKIDLAKYGQGVTIIHIYYSHFKDMLIDIPSLAEQRKIADFLTAIDETITAKAEEITKVEQWKKGLMQKMFA